MGSKSWVTVDHCGRCGEAIGVILDRRMRETFTDSALYTSGAVCDDCRAELGRISAVIADGGVGFKCLLCGLEGAIRPSEEAMPLVDYVRKSGKEWLGFQNCEQHEKIGIYRPAEPPVGLPAPLIGSAGANNKPAEREE